MISPCCQSVAGINRTRDFAYDLSPVIDPMRFSQTRISYFAMTVQKSMGLRQPIIVFYRPCRPSGVSNNLGLVVNCLRLSHREDSIIAQVLHPAALP